jgi:hypothetical protein
MTEEKIRENRLRRMAERQGLRLEKSRRRDPRAYGFGTYHLIDPRRNLIVARGLPNEYGLGLDGIEDYLTGATDKANSPAREPLAAIPAATETEQLAAGPGGSSEHG